MPARVARAGGRVVFELTGPFPVEELLKPLAISVGDVQPDAIIEYRGAGKGEWAIYCLRVRRVEDGKATVSLLWTNVPKIADKPKIIKSMPKRITAPVVHVVKPKPKVPPRCVGVGSLVAWMV